MMPDARIALIAAGGEKLGLTTKVPGTAAGLTASTKIFGEKDAAGARWVAGDFTKYAPAETLIEPRRLEVDRVTNTRPAATPTRFFLRQRHHASTDIATP
jgi:hypothetical protein